QWVITGYTLALATVMPITAWAISRLGGKRVYLLALALFVAGSVTTGLAWNVASLIGFRVLQGLGGGLIMPVAMTLALRAAPPAQRGRILGILGIPVLIGPALGPTLGGWILDTLSWRWIFFINLPIGILAITLAAATLRAEPSAPTHRLDPYGLVLLSPGLAALIYGLSTGAADGGLSTPRSLVPTLAGTALILAFTARTLTTMHPLLDLRLLRLRPMATGAGVLVLFAAAYFGSMFLVPLYYQIVRGQSAFASGVLMLPQALATGITMQFAARLIDRVAPRRVIGTGIALATLGFAVFAVCVSVGTGLWVLLVALAIAGVGIGATLMPTMTTAVRWLTGAQLPSASTLLNVTQQTAVSIGTAATSVLLGAALSHRLPNLAHHGVGDLYQLPNRLIPAITPQIGGAFSATLWLPTALMAASLVTALLWLPRVRKRAHTRQPTTCTLRRP
ncbi:MAG: DHA2 family efflux MFS transporter permease subunit, partial [Sciscionella sp.]